MNDRENPLISIIVPVYQVEKYVGECLESILKQTYKHLEVICVDDGSTDDSGKICDWFSAQDPRVIVIHTGNNGAGAARNTALRRAAGQYIGFVDSDDFIDPTMYEELMRIALKYQVDIVSCEYRDIYVDAIEERPVTHKTDIFHSSDFLAKTTEHWTYYVMWNKIFHRDVIGCSRFPEGNVIDDEFFTYSIIGRAKRIAYYSEVLYNYRRRMNSAMHSVNHNLRKDRESLRIDQEKLKYIKEQYPNLLGIFQRKMLNDFIAIIREGRISEKEKIVAIKFMRKNCNRALFRNIRLKESLYFLAYMYIPFIRKRDHQMRASNYRRAHELFS